MGRLKPLRRSDLDPEQRALYDAITTGKRAAGRDPSDFLLSDGGLRGPFNPWLYAPKIGQPAQSLGESVRYHTDLSPRLRELAILTVAAHWRADYEWWAHSRIGRETGLGDATLAAVKNGHLPDNADPGEKIVHRFARELMEDKRLGDDTYGEALSTLGERGAVELVALLGYYTLVSMTLCAFDVKVPEGETPPFARDPRHRRR